MFLSNFSIKRPVSMIVLIIAMMAVGLLALSKLRVNREPDVELPMLFISIPYPGASPETVEREVVNRLEKSLQSIAGVEDLFSTSGESGAQFEIRFNFDKNLIEASDEVRNAIAAVRYKLPTEMREPMIQRIDTSAQPVMQLALSSKTLSHAAISRLAEDKLADRFRALDGVAVVNVNGALRRELSVLLRADKLREYNVSVGEVSHALQMQNTNAPVGKVRGALEEKGIRLVGRIERPEEFKDVVVKRRGNEVIRLGQLAQIEDGFAEIHTISKQNLKPNVALHVVRARDASAVSVAKSVRALTADINKELAADGTVLDITEDDGKNAQESLDNVIEALVFGAVLTIFVVYAFLNSWRSTLITALALPTSVIAAFIAVWLCGFTLNFMTLLGLSLAIGVLIDDAIVVRENIVRHMQNGSDRRTAALEGTAEIGLAVAATTFSIMAVFIPVAFMPGLAGEWFRPFALTVTCSVAVSLFISFTLDPMLSAYWGDPPDHHSAPKKGIGKQLDRFNHWFDQQAGRYGKVIAWALRHRRWMGAIALASFAGAIVLQATLGGTSFVPKQDRGTIRVDVRTPSSSSLAYTTTKMDKVAAIAHGIKEVKATEAYINLAGGNIWINIGKRNERERDAVAIASELRQKLAGLVGGEYTVVDDLGGGGGKPVQIDFVGPDSRKLMEITNEFMGKLRQVPGAVDVGLSEQDPKDELQIELHRGLANSMGIAAGDAASALRVAFAGIEVGDWVDPTGEARDVAVRLHPADRAGLDSIARLPIGVAGSSQMVPLEQIASITMGKGPATIRHKNGKRTISVTANVEGRSPGEVTADARKIADNMVYPEGFGQDVGGASREQNEIFTSMGIGLLSGIGLMYLVLVMQFGSFTAPGAVMLSLPLSLIGVVVGLLLTGGTLNLMSLIGVIMLMGLVAKNAILLLDAARKLEEQGAGRQEALMQAGQMRLRPILMTTFALIAGMMPVAIGMGNGGEFYRPMAVAIIGGTITSTLLTLLVVPTFYDSIEQAREGMVAKFLQRDARWGAAMAFLLTAGEALAALLMLRMVFRLLRGLLRRLTGGRLRARSA
ncbi:AcrB/AcrD/AcrF family protein [Pseudoduganella sp. DS3]|uniref:AcrB/AcrD/AcrF family protein n=1 Tax=Pseudoduganella guangdongensis TaxID=2692179 RepID=A0A6N9HRB6_9BURK|nr:efflux RND transporter permease subunit [Pseudoduganella guangdongensis]MYN05405.1 AcrB/AcrD/AcrF family protein [Pseudoduganella guangdongensis]